VSAERGTAAAGREREAPAALRSLLERFDPDPIDVPGKAARVRLQVRGEGSWDAALSGDGVRLVPSARDPDALLSADARAWEQIAADIRGGMEAFRDGRLHVRQNLHLGIGFLAATSGITGPGRLRFHTVDTRVGKLSALTAGTGDPVVCIHGLGGTKVSFVPTVAALAERYRIIALDLPGFGESDKPILAPYDASYFARSVIALLDRLQIERAHLIGNSMGGRVAIELGLRYRRRVGGVALLSPALAWLRERPWKGLLRLPLPRLGLIQPTPRGITEAIVRRLVPSGSDGWAAAGVDEFLRSYLTPRGRVAFYEAARNIYLDEPHGERGFWTRLRRLSAPTMFVWGRRDALVPIGFMKHVETTLPGARHLELDCGHVPQLERPRETHAAIREFLSQLGA
jgi:pimeloyl-ACP methyl ester carboxylesterase